MFHGPFEMVQDHEMEELVQLSLDMPAVSLGHGALWQQVLGMGTMGQNPASGVCVPVSLLWLQPL